MFRIAWFATAALGIEISVGLALWKWPVIPDAYFYPILVTVFVITLLALVFGLLSWRNAKSQMPERISQGGVIKFGINQETRSVRLEKPINTDLPYDLRISPTNRVRWQHMYPGQFGVERNLPTTEREELIWKLEGTVASRNWIIR